MFFSKYNILILLTVLMFAIGACGTPAQTESAIATSVAQTVQARDSLTKVSNIPTLTPIPPTEIVTTSDADPVQTNTPASILAPGCTVSARLVSENPPDGALLRPGEFYWKTWTIQNTGTCTWDSSYKLVYQSGDLMGGLASYAFPQLIAPNESKDVSIYLKAPETEGTFTGNWQIQSPWGVNFGVGPTSLPFYVKVKVSNDANLWDHQCDYNIVRNPATGCPVNVRNMVYATITTNGPYEFKYFWDQSDGNRSKVETLTLTQAGSVTVSREWMIGRGDSPNPRWMMIVVTAPEYREFSKAVILNTCP
jgi:hypothetical protein